MHAHDSRITTWYTHITIPVCFVTSVLSYMTIFWKLQKKLFANFGDALSLSPQNLNCKTHKPTPLAKSVVNVSPNVAVCL